MAEINNVMIAGNEGLGEVLNSILNDLTAMRTQINAAVADLGESRSVLTVLVAKLNADGGVSDANYVGPTALTSAAVTSLETTRA